MRVFCYYDVSGSVSKATAERFFSEAMRRRASIEHTEWLEFFFDMEVHTQEEYLSNPRLGCGGTDSKCVVEHWRTHAKPGDALLVITDGYIPPFPEMPESGHFEVVAVQ